MGNLYDAMLMAIDAYAEISGMDKKAIAEECKKMDGPIYNSVLMMVVMAR